MKWFGVGVVAFIVSLVGVMSWDKPVTVEWLDDPIVLPDGSHFHIGKGSDGRLAWTNELKTAR